MPTEEELKKKWRIQTYHYYRVTCDAYHARTYGLERGSIFFTQTDPNLPAGELRFYDPSVDDEEAPNAGGRWIATITEAQIAKQIAAGEIEEIPF